MCAGMFYDGNDNEWIWMVYAYYGRGYVKELMIVMRFKNDEMEN